MFAHLECNIVENKHPTSDHQPILTYFTNTRYEVSNQRMRLDTLDPDVSLRLLSTSISPTPSKNLSSHPNSLDRLALDIKLAIYDAYSRARQRSLG